MLILVTGHMKPTCPYTYLLQNARKKSEKYLDVKE